MVICSQNGVAKYSWNKDHFYFVDKPCEKRNPGYPLDSISVMPDNNKYWLELPKDYKEEYNKKDNTEGVVEFIINNV